MSNYQVLARKYRPKNFYELIGQNHVCQALTNAIDTQRLHHAYLFTGTRGVGKTTIARILAKCLNCETGITSTPCGVCDVCISVDDGRFIDLIEIDAASRTKVEDTRDLLENVPYAPTQGRYKVYLIDEVHMLSTHSFNALLKTLEEPPEHTKFILATTDPQKLPVTIISRCLQFVLRPLPQEMLYQHLMYILNQEQVGFCDKALWQLAKSAKGSVRDALSLTDQAIAFGGGVLTEDTVTQMLGLVDSLDIVTLIENIFTDNRLNLTKTILKMRQQMVDAIAILDDIADTLHDLAMIQTLPDVPLDMSANQAESLLALAKQVSPTQLQLFYTLVNKSREEAQLATTPMQALEMTIIRMIAFDYVASNQMPQTSLNENLANENLANENLANENLANENLANENLANENLANENLANENLANPTRIDSHLPINQQQLSRMLKPPVQELTGVWTADKWDYWLSLARENQWLDADELALASQSIMMGSIDGECTFYTTNKNMQTNVTFKSFVCKFTQHFQQAKIDNQLHILSDNPSLDVEQLPKNKAQSRQIQVYEIAQRQIMDSPNFQLLYQQGYLDTQNSHQMIKNIKLTFN